MEFGAYLKKLREDNDLSQRQLAEMANISNTEVSRLESGERRKPSPLILKTIAPFLGVDYKDLMAKAGYIEEIVEHDGFTERVYRDERGKLIDVERRTKEMYEKNSDWANLAYRVSAELDDDEIELIKVQTQALLSQFLKNKQK